MSGQNISVDENVSGDAWHLKVNVEMILYITIFIKCQKMLLLTQTFRVYHLSSVWETVNNTRCSKLRKVKARGRKKARAQFKCSWNWCWFHLVARFLNKKISLISTCLRWMLFPVHKRIPSTWTSAILWPVGLKCYATGKPGVLLRMLRRCSPIRLLRLRPVSSM